MTTTIDNPILNSPYELPDQHYEIGPQGPTGVVKTGRRPSESFIPIAITKKGKRGKDDSEQEVIDFDATGERREKNSLINRLRQDVGTWRNRGYNGVTPITRNLLLHWADEKRENRVLFCQREAAETAIFLIEVAGRHGYADWRKELEPENDAHNAGLPRAALKMATGSGKTVVMAMLIAWQTLNKVQSPRDARFTNRFLVVTPGITIRDRLRVLMPSDPGNYYLERDLIPADLKGGLDQARIVITNYHAFQLKDAKEIRGVARNTRLLLKAGRSEDPFKETPQAMVSRVLRDLGGHPGEKQQIVVFNDEAHHCYADRITTGDVVDAEDKAANEEARVWFKGLQAVAKYAGIKQIFDLSATPFYLKGSGYNEGYIFPWTVSDFSLMDAIESGIVKVPRTPVDDDADHELVTYLRLWDFVGDKLPKRAAKGKVDDWLPPPELEGALRSLHRSYERAFRHWEAELQQVGEMPPVFIVVCPNTVVSKLVYDWIAGESVVVDDQVIAHKPGNLALLSNVVDGQPLARPRTILIDSAQLESGEGMKADFKQVVGPEIAAFKQEYRRRNPGADVDKITDEELLREVMNTVGKPGKLGEQVRCVVSVSMLTEGWDANTVTHILGVRAFRSQLLCEQVVGRGLRRRSYAVNPKTKHFEPEYANVYGIPFQFISSDKPSPDPLPPKPVVQVHAVEGREDLRITFPKLTGYRVELPDEEIVLDLESAPTFEIGPNTVPRWVAMQGVVGREERERGEVREYRPREVAFALAKRILDSQFNTAEDKRPWLFPKLVGMCQDWLEQRVRVAEGHSLGYLMEITEAQAEAAEKVWESITRLADRRGRLRPMLDRFEPEGSTGDVNFPTRKRTWPTEKSEVSHVTLDGADGNTWEQLLAAELELNKNAAAYVKNDHLGFVIPYVHKGRTHSYIPDFLVRLVRVDGDIERTLIIEVSGSQKSPGPTQAKATTARDSWCAAVNNHGGFGRWGYIELTDPLRFKTGIAEAIRLLYDDAPIIGDPDLLDFDQTGVADAAYA